MKAAITGAYSYTGKYVAQDLLDAGHEVITLTGSPHRPDPFGGRVPAYPFNFHGPDQLARSLRGVDTLINTYWVRFDYGESTFFRAISNTRTLFQAAKQAGVKRVVHISITNPDPQSKLPYFWGKALLEEDLIASGLSHAILRPTVIFGQEDILINNIAWFLRRFPVFPLLGDGEYRLQPVFVRDLAGLATAQAFSDENAVIDAIGPETFTFKEMVTMIRNKIGSKARVIPFPPGHARRLAAIMGILVGDEILTEDEVTGLMAGLLHVDSPPAGNTRLSDWVEENKRTLGKNYAHEIRRHYHSA